MKILNWVAKTNFCSLKLVSEWKKSCVIWWHLYTISRDLSRWNTSRVTAFILWDSVACIHCIREIETIARLYQNIYIHLSLWRQISRDALLVSRGLGNFIICARPSSLLPPFIYGNPLLMPRDLKLCGPISAAAAHIQRGRAKSLLLLDVRVSMRPIWLTFRKLKRLVSLSLFPSLLSCLYQAVKQKQYARKARGALSSTHISPPSRPRRRRTT